MLRERLHLPTTHQGAVWINRWRPALHPRHLHDELELNLVLSGRMTYLVGDRRIELGARTLLWLFPEQEHQVIATSRDFSMFIAVFCPVLARRAARALHDPRLAAGDPAMAGHCQLVESEARLLAGLLQAARAGEDTAAVLNAAIQHLLMQAWRLFQAAGAVAPHQVHPGVARAADLLARNPAVDGAALARAVGLGRTRLARLFKCETGQPLSAFRNRLRVDRFLVLARSGRPLLLAAEEAGFGSYSQCHAVVRLATGLSPRAAVNAQIEEPGRPDAT
jgi:AraC-like DNA-binding protein